MIAGGANAFTGASGASSRVPERVYDGGCRDFLYTQPNLDSAQLISEVKKLEAFDWHPRLFIPTSELSEAHLIDRLRGLLRCEDQPQPTRIVRQGSLKYYPGRLKYKSQLVTFADNEQHTLYLAVMSYEYPNTVVGTRCKWE